MIFEVTSDYNGKQIVEAASMTEAIAKAKAASVEEFKESYKYAPEIDEETDKEIPVEDAIPHEDIEPRRVERIAYDVVR